MNVVAVETGKPDKETAQDIRSEFEVLLAPVADALNRANAKGFTVGFSIAPGPSGRQTVQPVQVSKHF